MEPLSDEAIEAHVRRTPPDCLAAFHAVPLLDLDRSNASIRAEWHCSDPFKSLCRLQCRCGSGHGRLLGRDPKDYNPDCHGDEMATPIAFECRSCLKVAEILDTDVHGCHAEVSRVQGGVSSAKVRGVGDRKAYCCAHCKNDTFDFVVGFVYWDFEIIFDEPQNFFNEFLMLRTCVRCGNASEPVMLDL